MVKSINFSKMLFNIAIMLLAAVLIALVGLGVNKAFYDTNDGKLLLVTQIDGSEDAIVTYKGFGVAVSKLTVNKLDGIEGLSTPGVYKMYNKTAGTLSTWNGEMTLSEFKQYEKDLIQVNGSITNSKVYDDRVKYTFSNGEELIVKLINKMQKEFSHEISESDILVKTSEYDGYIYEEYSNGVVKILYEDTVNNQSETTLALYFDFSNFLYTVMLLVGVETIAVVVIYLIHKAVRKLREKKKKQ